MNDLETYVDFLYDGLEGYVYSPVKRPDSWDSHFFSWPTDRTALLDHITVNGSEADVYICPSVFSEKKATKENFKAAKVVWAEIDGKDLPNGELDFDELPVPSIIVQTSTQDHVHAYWETETWHSSPLLEEVNRRICYYLQADSSGWDSTQLLRPPSTTNHKHPLPVLLASHGGSKVDSKEFDVAPAVERISVEVTETDLVDPVAVLVKLNLPKSVANKITKEIPTVGDRSQFYYRIALDLAERGCSHKEIATIVYYIDERVKKWSERTDRMDRISELASIALHSIQSELQVSLYSPQEILDHTEELEWLYKKWLHTNGLMLVTGAPGVGKTQFLMSMTAALSAGIPFLQEESHGPVRSLFMSLEMDIRALKYILTKQVKLLQGKDSMKFFDENTRFLDTPSTLGEYEEKIIEFKPQLVCIDSLFELAVGDLKDTEDAKGIIHWLNRIRTKYNCAVIVIHHNRKGGTGNKKPNSLDDIFGSIYIQKAMETGIILWQDEGIPEIDLIVVKARFDEKVTIQIERTDQLTFEIPEDPSDNPEPGESGRVDGKPGIGTFG